jgi:hypothetical protein
MKYAGLGTLPEQVQRDILAGKASACALSALLAVARQGDGEHQQRAFDQLCAAAPARRRKAAPRDAHDAAAPPAEPAPLASLQVRVAGYFNPERFVEQRVAASKQLRDVQAFVAELNRNLASPRAKRTPAAIHAAIDAELRRRDLLTAFEVKLIEDQAGDRPRYQVQLVLDQADWEHRRRYDGFTVLVAHPTLTHSAAELCRLYRAKDVVEKDFQAIKGFTELRPLWHHNAGKVRAHVTVSMLALALERMLSERLRSYSAKAALQVLDSCRLNNYQAGATTLLSVTTPDPEQAAILRELNLQQLVDDDEVAERLMPRPAQHRP